MKLPFIQSAPGETPVIAQGYFGVPPDRVFQAWTDPDALRQWFALASPNLLSLSTDPQPGGDWHMRYALDGGGSEEIRGHYTRVEPPGQLSFTWQHEIKAADGQLSTTDESLVEIILVPDGPGTRLQLIHSQIVTEGGRRGVGDGWSAGLTRLQAYLA